MIALVTGASGAFGAHLAKTLLDEGHDVVSIAHDEHPYDTASLLGIRNKITWARGSLLDETFVKRVVADYGIHTIFHFAALPLVQVATRTTVPIFQTNFMGTVNLLEAVKENHWAGKPVRFIYVGTDKEYGDAGPTPYTEDMPLNGLAIYDCSKAAADLAVRTYAACNFAPAALTARCCNIVAPGDLNFGRVLPRTIIPCLRGDRPSLYKTNYLREFIDVEDAVDALLKLDLCLKEQTSRFHGQAFNVGSGEQRNLLQVVETILKLFPGITPIWTAPPALTHVEIPFQLLSTDKIRDWTGWKHRVSFEAAIHRLVLWWRDRWETLPSSIRNRQIKEWHG